MGYSSFTDLVIDKLRNHYRSSSRPNLDAASAATIDAAEKKRDACHAKNGLVDTLRSLWQTGKAPCSAEDKAREDAWVGAKYKSPAPK